LGRKRGVEGTTAKDHEKGILQTGGPKKRRGVYRGGGKGLGGVCREGSKSLQGLVPKKPEA